MAGLPAALRAALIRAAAQPRLLVASDFDGTLSEIVAHPPDARPVPGAVAALCRLTAAPGVTVALVSGRASDSLRRVSGMREPVRLIGSHGAEFGDGVGFPVDTALRDRIIEALNGIAAAAPGVSVETKPAGAALHVRNAAPDVAAAALQRARMTCGDGAARLTEGKAVLEFSVVHTDKGAAVTRLRDDVRAGAVVFAGDDVTDETVFARLGLADVGIKVGAGDTVARYRVASPADTVAVLEFLAAQRG